MSETLGVCTLVGVCAVVVSGLLSFLRKGAARGHTLQTWGRLSAQATLFPKGECDHVLLRALPTSHGHQAKWVPSSCSQGAHKESRVQRERGLEGDVVQAA